MTGGPRMTTGRLEMTNGKNAREMLKMNVVGPSIEVNGHSVELGLAGVLF